MKKKMIKTKKAVLFAAAILLPILLFAACSSSPSGEGGKSARGSDLLKDLPVAKATVSSLPPAGNYAFSADACGPIVDYLSSLELTRDFDEDPDTYGGRTWVIALEYQNGEKQTVYHFGNLFLRADGGPWYKMDYEAAALFDRLIAGTDTAAPTVCWVFVREVEGSRMLVAMNGDDTGRLIAVPLSAITDGSSPAAGDTYMVYYDGTLSETFPSEFGGLRSVEKGIIPE